MTYELSPQDVQRAATRYVNRKIRFSVHLTVYLMVNIGLVGANLLQNSTFMWSFGPLVGWGIGLLFHGFSVFLSAPGATWKQRMIENEMNRLKQRT